MLSEAQTLIVVYKDELVLNQLKKLVETNDDTPDGKIVGTQDGSVTIVAWDEKMWLEQKKSGTIESKVLFIGNIKGTDKLEPVIDVKYDKWGIKYGWAGKQAYINVNEWAIKKEEYKEFLEDFKTKTLPEKKQEALPLKVAIKGGITVLFGLLGLGASFVTDFFMDKSKLRQQMFLYGILQLYENDLETFMKS
ncbi:hypothetical protein [Butyrivibrio sp. XPD2002]|uniref:hypothetical protein n=1 Tax=Butyrivibrio sp. XPD2002 TaxID=1280665 RepID=UPI0003F53C76|nr:hypothetical protein [Butyrivibrio sp. XPD2002]